MSLDANLDFVNQSLLTKKGENEYNNVLNNDADDTQFIYRILTPSVEDKFKIHDLVESNFDSKRDNIKILKSDLLPIVVESIQENGFNTANNDFLTYLLNTNDVVNLLNMKNIALIQNFINKEDIDIRNSWLYDARAYDTNYKLQALAFLSSDKANRYGNNPDRLIDDILKVTGSNDKAIKRMLDAWGTKDTDKSRTVLDVLKSLDSSGRFNNLQSDDKDGASLILIKEAIINLLKKFYKEDLLVQYKPIIDQLCSNGDPYNAIRLKLLDNDIYEQANETRTQEYVADQIVSVIKKLMSQDTDKANNDINKLDQQLKQQQQQLQQQRLKQQQQQLLKNENKITGLQVLSKVLGKDVSKVGISTVMSYVKSIADRAISPSKSGDVTYVAADKNRLFNQLESDMSFRSDLSRLLQQSFDQTLKDGQLAKLLAGDVITLLRNHEYIKRAV